MIGRAVACLAAAAGVVAGSGTAAAQGTLRATVPALLSVTVIDVSTAAEASPDPSTVSFDTAILVPTQAVRISVKADTDLAGPNGSSIPASKLSWTTSGAANGIGVNGTLSASSYATVFEGQVLTTSGSVDVTWTLGAPGAAVRSGNHQVVLRWRFEAFTP